MVVLDNGTGFTILHVKTAAGYPSLNGHLLRSVHIFRDRIKKLEGLKGTVHTKLSRFLLAYGSTAQPKMSDIMEQSFAFVTTVW